MVTELEKSHETISPLRIGDEVIYLPDGSHQIVIDAPDTQAVNTAVISQTADGCEAFSSIGSSRFEKLGQPIGRWDTNRIANALWRSDFVKDKSDESRDKLKEYIQTLVENQETG